MTQEEKSAWVIGGVSVVGYAIYLVIVLGQARDTPLAEAPYVVPMLWTIGGAIVASIVVSIVLSIVTGTPMRRGAIMKDQRDREISRIGDYVGNSFATIGGVSALAMAMAEWDHFWIANVIYLGFFLSTILGSATKIFAYRRGGFQQW